MRTKYLAGLAPLLAVAAFAVMPAMASAVPAQWTSNGVAITSPVNVVSSNVAGSVTVLKGDGHTIECSVVKDKSTLYPGATSPFPNVVESGAGTDFNVVQYSSCKDASHPTCKVTEPITLEAYTFLAREEGLILNFYVPKAFFETGSLVFATVDLGAPCNETLVAEGNEAAPVFGVTDGSLQLFDTEPGQLTINGKEAQYTGETTQEGEEEGEVIGTV